MSGTDAGVFGRWAKGRIKGALEDTNPQGDRDAIIRRLASFGRSVKVSDKPAGAPLPGCENPAGGVPGPESVPGAISRMREVSSPDAAGNHSLAPPDSLCCRAVMAAGSAVAIPEGARDPLRNGVNALQGDPWLPVSGEREAKPPTPDVTGTVRSMPLILIVEDEPVTQQIVRRILESRGYETVVAKDGIEALMQLARRQFDLILSDLLMPDLGGFKLLELLNKKGISTPVVFLTASDNVEDEIKGLSLGAKDYILKPVNRDLLLLRVRKSLDRAAAG